MPKKGIAETVKQLILPTVTQLGYHVWDVTYQKIGADYHLEVTIDHPDGISIDDCEKVHRSIDPVLDEADPIMDAYYLDVSSPGLEREIRTEEHIAFCIGEKVEVKLFSPMDGLKHVTGVLKGYDDGKVTLLDDTGKFYVLDRTRISRMRTLFSDNVALDEKE
ncbi:MAG: ribosome maturation factor RimP [Clostridia bacterium]|nr:ribosome maturation factor RimP [Clostridia bacterium]